MKMLAFLARSFAWQPFAPVLEGAPAAEPGSVADAVVVFVHAERADEDPERWKGLLEHARKHVEWLARKKELRAVVLHSFAHLGGETGDAQFGRRFLAALAERLRGRGFTVAETPFGWTNAWQIDVHGEGNAKVWKEL